MSAVAEKSGDEVALSGDLALMGDIVAETSGDSKEALARYRAAVESMERARAPDEIKEAARRNLVYDEALVAIRDGDLRTAKEKAEAYRRAVDAHDVPVEVQQVHELAGRIALEEGRLGEALAELGRGNQ
jgi:hypothetical protein